MKKDLELQGLEGSGTITGLRWCGEDDILSDADIGGLRAVTRMLLMLMTMTAMLMLTMATEVALYSTKE